VVKDRNSRSDADRHAATPRRKRQVVKSALQAGSAPARSGRRPLLKLTFVCATVTSLLLGLIALGHYALDRLRGSDRYTIPFTEIECIPPPGQVRADFLDEVQYLAGLPARLRVLEPDLARRLATGFALHPWVAKVEQIEILTARHVKVRLTYRRPVLAIRTNDGLRVVDADGILLPRQALREGLPIYRGEAPPPIGPAGVRWGDDGVEAAARQLAGRRGE
jgi:hypothetical protein